MGVTTQYPSEIVVAATCLTSCIVTGLTIYAFTTKTDFTIMGGSLFILFFLILGVGLLAWLMNSQ